uniref:ATPase cation transporting 13A2 n=1 Tax=Myripristis murdjan TaxID=586833 RepID=A0A668ABV8_9TELE
MDVQGYRWVCWKVWFCRLAAVLTLGLLLILFHWRPRLAVLARCSSCPLALADVLLLRDGFGQQYVVQVLTEEVADNSMELLGDQEDSEWRDTVQLHKEEKMLLRYYLFEGLRYVWLARKGAFCRVSVLNEDWTCSDLHSFQNGLSPLEQSSRRHIYGPNLIDVPVKSYMRLLVEEVLNPFYVFQVFSITLWMVDKYYYYASCIFLISVLSISISLYEIHKVSLKNKSVIDAVLTVSSENLMFNCTLFTPQQSTTLRNMAHVATCSPSLCPGESVPVLKTPLPASEGRYSSDSERRHTLFCGTQLIQAKGRGTGGTGAIAVVTSTGFFTAKGDLISSILYPQPINFRFYRDAAKFLLFLGFVALIGTIYSFIVLRRSNATVLELVIRTLDIVTIVVPPALPAAITTGTIYAQRRLKRQGVFCISPPRINVCGKISLFCFDKTGTLTEEGLDVWGVMEVGPTGFSELVSEPRLLPRGPMLYGLACCHTVALLGGQPLGDPLELKMIESTGWLDSAFGGYRVLAVMRPPAQQLQAEGTVSCPGEAMAIIRRFPFSSALQRMSVVTVAPGGHPALAFIKGSPEMVASLCLKETVPAQFSSILRTFASDGFRVLALGHKTLDGKMDLKTVERLRDMQFLGLLVMKNLVKPESAGVINTLRLAQLRTVMVTGDNILTAVNVAKSCGMVGSDDRVIFVHATPHTAQSMPTLRFHLGEGGATAAAGSVEVITQVGPLIRHSPLILSTGLYARMAPDQKTQLVKELQKLNYRVGMCGDGANDCGALRAADVGVSLSEAEASVASPFTSKSDNISCVPLLIREGRCSLVTSFSLFRYMALYSLIQFCSVLILYTMKTNLGDLQFLFFDMFLVTLLAILMGTGGPSEELYPRRPPASLLALPVLGSLLIHTSMIVLGQLAALFVTISQDWYIPLNSTKSGAENLPNMEDTCVFALSGFQYIIMAIVVTKGYPHKNWLVLYPGPVIGKLLQLYNISDMNFKMLLVALAALNLLVCFLFEVCI